MDDEIQLISDGDGLAVIGEPSVVERFLLSEGLPAQDLGLPRLGSLLGAGGAMAQAGSQIAANSGRWVQLTKESAGLVKKYGLMDSKTPGVSHAMIGKPGNIKSWVQIAKGPGSFLTNPANLAGAAGLMAQLSMQQMMNEITDYLAVIEEKVDDVLRAQTDAVVAEMIGVDLVIEEAMAIRAEVGRVSEVTWSKLESTSLTIAQTQAYALRQLDALADKLERKNKIGDLADAAKETATKVQEWLAVLAHCFQLQDAIGILELDRVLDASPEELDRHRIGLRTARQNRLKRLSDCTENLLARMNAAADVANTKVLMHPTASPAVVQSSNHVAKAVGEFHGRLGIESAHQSSETRRWVDAATQVKAKALESSAESFDTAKRLSNDGVEAAKRLSGEGVDAAKRLSSETRDRAKSAKSKVIGGMAELRRRKRDDDARVAE